jgi:hypothetical protein
MDGEAEAELGALARMSARQGDPLGSERRQGTQQELAQGLFDLGLGAEGHCRQGQRRPRLGAHGEDVVERVDCGDATEQERIVQECPEIVDRLDRHEAWRHPDHRRVVRCVQPEHEIRAGLPRQVAQHTFEHRRPDLRAAAPAPHRRLA